MKLAQLLNHPFNECFVGHAIFLQLYIMVMPYVDKKWLFLWEIRKCKDLKSIESWWRSTGYPKEQLQNGLPKNV